MTTDDGSRRPAKRQDRVFSVDMSELVEGYQFDGRGRAIQEWKERKDGQAFEALCNRLRVAKWTKEVREEGGPRLVQLRKRGREWVAENRDREAENARDRKRRREAHAARGEVLKCVGCGRDRPKPFRAGGTRPKFCSDACRQRTKYRAKPGTGLSRCSRCGKQGHSKPTCPGKEETP